MLGLQYSPCSSGSPSLRQTSTFPSRVAKCHWTLYFAKSGFYGHNLNKEKHTQVYNIGVWKIYWRSGFWWGYFSASLKANRTDLQDYPHKYLWDTLWEYWQTNSGRQKDGHTLTNTLPPSYTIRQDDNNFKHVKIIDIFKMGKKSKHWMIDNSV